MSLVLRRATPFERKLGYRFRDLDLLEMAFTHRSWAHEHRARGNYERLEFLGDAVLGLVAAEWLYRRFPELPEGELSKLKAMLVSRPSLARYAGQLGLGERLRLGVGEERSGGREKDSILADGLEAVWGAIYLDGGLGPARQGIHGFLEQAIGEPPPGVAADSKTRLQELTQARGLDLPVYHLVGESGPDHEKRFAVICEVDGETAGRGEGRSKKLAEQRAAAAALARLEEIPEEDRPTEG
jgi:ribonuclease-3